MNSDKYIVDKFGTVMWFAKNTTTLHREDGPAIIRQNGSMAWYINGKRHRIDGPAIIWEDDTYEWWLNGNDITDQVDDWIKSTNNLWSQDHIWDEYIIAEFLLVFSQ